MNNSTFFIVLFSLAREKSLEMFDHAYGAYMVSIVVAFLYFYICKIFSNLDTFLLDLVLGDLILLPIIHVI